MSASLVLSACTSEESELKRFPFSKLVVREADISSNLAYNPIPPAWPPRQRWSIGISIEPIVLGAAATAPDIETVVDSAIIISDLELPVASWKDLPGRYEFDPPHEGGSFYVTQRHNPVDVHSLRIRHVEKQMFDLELDLSFDFDFEGTGYRNERVTIATRAQYTGFSFVVPTWTHPERITCPADWGVPSTSNRWSHDDLREFVSRHVDLSSFGRVNIEENGDLMLEAAP